MMKRILVSVVAALMFLPLSSQAAGDKQNFLGLGLGVAAAGGSATDPGYAFLFQMQQSRNAAIGFAFHQGEIITMTYKGYTGAYADSVFWEGGFLIATAVDVFAPSLGAGIDMPFGDTSRLSFTVGTAFSDVGNAFVARAAIMFEM